MKIAFDVDNVLADSAEIWCKKASKYLKKEISKNDIKSHKIVGTVPMSPSEIFQLQDEVWIDWQSLPPTEPNLSQKLATFREVGFQVFIATSRPLRFIEFVKKWLTKHKISYDKFYAIGPYKLKSEIGVDALVDDAPSEIRRFLQMGGTGFLYLQPWNINHKIKRAIIVHSISDVMNYYAVET